MWLPLCKDAAALVTTKKRYTRSRKDPLVMSFVTLLSPSVASMDSLGLHSASASHLPHTLTTLPTLPTLQDLETEFTSLI